MSSDLESQTTPAEQRAAALRDLKQKQRLKARADAKARRAAFAASPAGIALKERQKAQRRALAEKARARRQAAKVAERQQKAAARHAAQQELAAALMASMKGAESLPPPKTEAAPAVKKPHLRLLSPPATLD